MTVKRSTVSVTTTLVHTEEDCSSNEIVAGQYASRTQPVHIAGAGAVAFEVASEVWFAVLSELEEVCAMCELLADVVLAGVVTSVDVDNPKESEVLSLKTGRDEVEVDMEEMDWYEERLVDDDASEEELKLTAPR